MKAQWSVENDLRSHIDELERKLDAARREIDLLRDERDTALYDLDRLRGEA